MKITFKMKISYFIAIAVLCVATTLISGYILMSLYDLLIAPSFNLNTYPYYSFVCLSFFIYYLKFNEFTIKGIKEEKENKISFEEGFPFLMEAFFKTFVAWGSLLGIAYILNAFM